MNIGPSSASLRTPRGQEFEARLTSLGGKKLDKFDLANETAGGIGGSGDDAAAI